MTYKTVYWDADAKEQRERDCTPDEIAEIEQRKADAVIPATNAPILAQIADLERQGEKPRRVREALATTAGKNWMVALDAQIAALRSQLVK